MNYVENNIAVFTAVFFFIIPELLSIRLKEIKVPNYSFWNKSTELECLYDLETGETLYSVQWYKDNDEFYRFVPKSAPPKFRYPIDDIEVDLPQSNEKKVTLKNVNLIMGGVYRCEVSAEAPSFITVNGEKRMEVIAWPDEGPHIDTDKKMYRIGDIINLTCISGQSYPSTQLRWFINDEEVKAEYNTYKNGSLLTTVTKLLLKAERKYFVKDQIPIRCQATIANTQFQHDNVHSKDALYLVKGNCAKIVPSFFLCTTLLLLSKSLHDIT